MPIGKFEVQGQIGAGELRDKWRGRNIAVKGRSCKTTPGLQEFSFKELILHGLIRMEKIVPAFDSRPLPKCMAYAK
jgi:hypothetical protein